MKNFLLDIKESDPTGPDLKYSDMFLEIEQEIDKNYSVNSNTGTNWTIVEQNSYIFLSHSKDFKIATWWLYSLWKNKQFNGILDGLKLYDDFINKYKSNFHPKSLKSQTNIANWLENKFAEDIVMKKALCEDLKLLEQIVVLLEKLQDTFKSMLEDQSNFFSKTIRYLKSIETTMKNKTTSIEKKETIVKKSAEIKKNENNQKKDTVTLSINKISNKNEEIKKLQELKKTISLLNEYYRKESSSDLRAMKMTRLISWLNIDILPANKENKTQLNPPSKITLNNIENFIEEENYTEALILSEKTIERSPFWLDGHFVSFSMLNKLNKTREASYVKNTLNSFINSNEGIEKLLFSDNTPFISEQTQEICENYIHNEDSLSINDIEISNDNKEFDENDENYLQIIKESHELVKNNKLKDAMELLQKNYNLTSNHEEKFKIRLEHAKIALVGKKDDIAFVFLKGLEKKIRKFNLNIWRPELACKVYLLILNHFQDNDENDKILKNAYKNLCKIDIAQILNLNYRRKNEQTI